MIINAVKKVSSPIIFAILGIVGYLMWNNFEKPKIFIGETQRVEGRIYDVSIGYGVRGIGYIQNVKFVYSIGNKNYIGTKKVDNKYGIQSIGNEVIVEVSIKNPDYYDVKGFKEYFSKGKFSKSKYLKSGNAEYEEILIENGIFKYKIIQMGGIEKYSLTGLVKSNNDTITVDCFKVMVLTDKNERNVQIIENDSKRLTFVENEIEFVNIRSLEKYKVLTRGK